MKRTQVQAQVDAFLAACEEFGFQWSMYSMSVVAISKFFTPGDKEAFTHCDMFAGSVLELAPLRGGSVFGTDGGSVGGYVALKNGQFQMRKSGEGKRFMAELQKRVCAKVVGQ
jgi:hypothetical protein